MIQIATSRTQYPTLIVGITLAILSLVIGALIAFFGPIRGFAILIGFCLMIWTLSNIERGLWATTLIVTMLPFGTIPFRFVLTPTLLDITLAAVFLLYAAEWMTGRRRRLIGSPAHLPILTFMLLALFSFVVGSGNATVTPNLLRKFVGFILNIALAFLVVDYFSNQKQITRLLRVIILGGSAAALVGLVLYLLPMNMTEQILNTLHIINYPTDSVLRFIEDNPTNALRANGTSVDPNAFGGMLAIVGALIVPYLAIARPLFDRRWPAWLMFGLIAASIILSFSRTAMAALLISILFVTSLRHRKLLWLLAITIIFLIFMPIAQEYSNHFFSGIQGQDLATRMRLGEYKDALTLISRYPFFGVGFGGTPDVDIYLGVSSAYLLLAEQTGLVGLFFFMSAIAVVLGWGLRHHSAALSDSSLSPNWLGIHAALLAALVIGLLDHYFVNLAFQAAQTFFWLLVGLSLASTRLAHGLK